MLSQSSALYPINPNLLPDEIFVSIFKYLSPRELAVASMVCSRWHNIALDNLVWKSLSNKRWPGCRNSFHATWKTFYRANSCDFASNNLCSRKGRYLYSCNDRRIVIWKQREFHFDPGQRPTFTYQSIATDHQAPITTLQLQYEPYQKHTPRLITGSGDTTLKIWKKIDNPQNEDMRCIETIKAHDDIITTLVVDGKIVISGSMDRTIKIWETDFAAGCTRLLHTLVGHTGMITSLQIGRNNLRDFVLYSASSDQTIRVWSIPAVGKPVCMQVLQGHKGSITCLSTSLVDRFLFSGSTDKTIGVWEKSLGGRLKFATSFEAHSRPVRCLQKIRFSPLLMSASDDGSIRIWKKCKIENTWKFKSILGQLDIPVTAIATDYAYENITTKKIFTITKDKVIKLWGNRSDTYEYDDLLTLNEHPG